MLRKLVILLIMVVHVNGSMFLPQVAEQDINTVIEYIDEVIMENHQKNPVDEDNDQGQNFHLVKMFDYYFSLELTPLKQRPGLITAKQLFVYLTEDKARPVTPDIPAPPPKV